jgi:hypothetical protein
MTFCLSSEPNFSVVVITIYTLKQFFIWWIQFSGLVLHRIVLAVADAGWVFKKFLFHAIHKTIKPINFYKHGFIVH